MNDQAKTARQMIQQIEAQGEVIDAMMQRAIDALKDVIADHAELEMLARQQTTTQAARCAFLVEAAMALSEEETGCAVRKLFRDRRPVLRVVQ